MGTSANKPERGREHVVMLRTGGAGAHQFLVAAADAPANIPGAYAHIGDWLARERLVAVHERAFGSLSVEDSVRAARRSALQARGLPVRPLTYVEGGPPWGPGWAGTIVHAIRPSATDVGVELLHDGKQACGCRWRRYGATFLVLQDLRGQGGAAPGNRATESRELITRAARLLHAHGAAAVNIVRTWFYLADILAWYDEFNATRTAAFRELRLLPAANATEPLPARLPASTGVGGFVAGGAAGVLDLLAVVPGASNAAQVQLLRNPRQAEPLEYGSAFARAVCVREPDTTLIEVSGTAAVDKAGRSLFPDDARAQMRYTLETVACLLQQAGAALTNIHAATAFVRQPADAAVLRRVLDDLGLRDFPAVCVVADICRPELLFELDAEAMIGPAAPAGRRTARNAAGSALDDGSGS